MVLFVPTLEVSKDGNVGPPPNTSAIFKDAFRDITDVSKISVHSLRAGGATSG